MEVAGIDIRIKNTFEPDHPGTVITRNYRGKESKVEIISGTDKVIAIEIHDPFMVGQVGYDLEFMKIYHKYNISYILKATNANSITTVIWESDRTDQLIQELNEKYNEVTEKQVALVSALGTNMAQPGTMAKATHALAGKNINIESISQSLKQVNIQFVIPRKDFKEAVIALNEALCFSA